MLRRNFYFAFLTLAFFSLVITGCGGGSKSKTLRVSGSLPASGTVNTAYGPTTLTVSGGTAPYSWTVSNLPAGVVVQGSTMAASITIGGTPTIAGTFATSATVIDSASPANTATVAATVTISAASSSPSVTTTSLPNGTVGTVYPGMLAATGGMTPYMWTEKSGGALPGGLSLTGSSGAIAGTPTAAGTFGPYVFTVTDANSKTADSPSLMITINAAASGPTVTTTSLPNGTVGTVYPGTLAATDGTTPYMWTEKSGGALPAGLSLTAGSGAIAGTPTATGTFGPYVFTVTDANNKTADSPSLMITVVSSTAEAVCAATPALRGNESALTSPYGFELNGEDVNDLPVAYIGSFTPDGKGGITAADIDFLGFSVGHESIQVQLAGSSYSYGPDGRGCLYLAFTGLNAGVQPALSIERNASLRHGNAAKRIKVRPAGQLANAGTVTFSFALGSSGQVGRIEEFDYVNSQMVQTGLIEIQTPGDFSVSKFAQHFAFGGAGWLTVGEEEIDRAAIAGSVSVSNSTGALTNSFADDNLGGEPSGSLTGGSGSLGTTVSSTTGRGTGSYTIPNGASTLTFNFVYYVLNADDFLFLSTDAPMTDGAVELLGRALSTSSGSQSLNGWYIPAVSGIDLSIGEDGGNDVAIGTIQATSEGAIPKATIYENDGGSFTTNPFVNGSYVTLASGRTTFTGIGGNAPVAYLTNTASVNGIAAFLVGTDSSALSGFLALQSTSTPNFNNASVDGNYAFGSFEDVVGINGSAAGAFTFTGTSNYTNVLDEVAVGEIASKPNQMGSGMLSVGTDGFGNFDSSTQVFVTNGTIILAIDATDGEQPLGYIFIKQ
jgi:Putative Ig domain